MLFRSSRVRVLPRILKNDHAPVEALLPRAFLPAHNVAEWRELPVTRLDSSAWDTAEWGARVEATLAERASRPDWPADPGHRLKLMGEIMWAAAPTKTSTPGTHARAPYCSKQQRTSSRMAASCRAAKLAIRGFQRAQLPAAAWPFLPANLRNIMDHRGADFPPPRSLDPREIGRAHV